MAKAQLGEIFTRILTRWEREVKTGAKTQAQFEQALAVYLPDWKERDLHSFRESRWYRDYGAASASTAAAQMPFARLTPKDQAVALYKRFAGDTRMIEQAVSELNLPPANLNELRNQIRFVDRQAFSSLTTEVKESTKRALRADLEFDAQTIFDTRTMEEFHTGPGQYSFTRRAGGRQVSDIASTIAASQGAIMRGVGDDIRIAMVKKAADPTDPANLFREQKTVLGQSGPNDSKVFVRKVGSDALEPLRAEPVSRADPTGNVFRQDWGQNVNFAVVARRFREEGQAWTVGQRYEAVVHQYVHLPGIDPSLISARSILGPHRQIELAPGIVHDTDDYTKTTITVHSSDSTGTWVRLERSVPLEGNTRFVNMGSKELMAGHAEKAALGIPHDLDVQFVADFSSVAKNPSAYWYGQVVRGIQDKGKNWLLSKGYHDAWDDRSGTVRWDRLTQLDHNFEYVSHDNPTQSLKGKLSRFQRLALEINNDLARWPTDEIGERGSIFLGQTTGSFTRSGGYAWRKPLSNLEYAARIAEVDPALYQQMLRQSAPRQEVYAEVMNVAFLNAKIAGVQSTNLKRVRDAMGRPGVADRALDLDRHPEIARQIVAAAQAKAKGGEVGYSHFAAALKETLVAHGYNPTDRLRFQANTGGENQTLYLTNARAGAYFSGPQWRQDMKSLLDDETGPVKADQMEKILSRFGRVQYDIVHAISQGQVIGEGMTNKLFNSENELIAGHDFNRNLTGLTVRHSWGGTITGDEGMPLGQIAMPDRALGDMFPELAAHPGTLGQLKALIDANDVVSTGTREPSIARTQQYFNLRMVTHDSVKGRITNQATDKPIVNHHTIGLASGDFDGDGFKSLVRSTVKLNKRTLVWEIRPGGPSIRTPEYKARQIELERQTWDQLTTDANGQPIKIGLVGMQQQSYREDEAKLAAAEGNLQVLQERQILKLGNLGEYTLRQFQAGIGHMLQSKQALGKSYNLGRRLRGLTGDDERYAVMIAKIDQTYVDSAVPSAGLQRFMENIEGYQPATGQVRRGPPGSKLKFGRYNTHDEAGLDTIAAFMQIKELGNSEMVAQILWPDDSDPEATAKRKLLIEIRETGEWGRLREVFGEHPYQDADVPLMQLLRTKASGRHQRRLERDIDQPGQTPLRSMSEADEAWAMLDTGQQAMTAVASAKFRQHNDVDRTPQENLAATARGLVDAYGGALGDPRMAEYLRSTVTPMLGLMSTSRHEVAEVLAAIKAQAAQLFNGPRARAATGGAFMVPPGFDADDYTIGVKSGERVTVETAAQVASQRFRGRGGSVSGRYAAGGTAYQPIGFRPATRGKMRRRPYSNNPQVTSSGWGASRSQEALSLFVSEQDIVGETYESTLGDEVHAHAEALALRPPAAGHTRFAELAMSGTATHGGRDYSVAGTMDLIDIYQEGGVWTARLFDYKTGGPRDHEKQLAFGQWLLAHGQVEPGEIPIDPATGARARNAAGEEIYTSGERFQAFLTEKGIQPGDIRFAGANIIEATDAARQQLKDVRTYQPDDPRRVAATEAVARQMYAQTLRSNLAPVPLTVDVSEVPGGVAEQQQLKEEVRRAYPANKRELERMRRARQGTPEAQLLRSLEGGGYAQKLGAVEKLMENARDVNLSGAARRPAMQRGAGGGRSGFSSYRDPLFEADMNVSAGVASTVGQSLMAWGQGGQFDMNQIIGSGQEMFFPPEMLKSINTLAAVQAGRGGQIRWDKVREAATNMQAFTQANLSQMPKEVQAYFAAPQYNAGQMTTPAGPGYDLFSSLQHAAGETRGSHPLVRTDQGVWSAELGDVTKNAPAEVKALVPVFNDLVTHGKALKVALQDLHAATTDVGKDMTGGQARWAGRAADVLGAIERRLVPLREAAEKGIPAEGSVEAHELGMAMRSAPTLRGTAARMAAGGPPGGGIIARLKAWFSGDDGGGGGGEGGEGAFEGKGVLGRIARGQQLLTGMQLFYMARLDRMFVEPGIKGVSQLGSLEASRAGLMAGVGIGYAPTASMQAMGAFQSQQNMYEQQMGMTWTPLMQRFANPRTSGALGTLSSTLGPGLGVGLVSAYLAGQILPEAAAGPVGLALGLGATAIGGGMALGSRQEYMQANPSAAALQAYRAEAGGRNMAGFVEFGSRLAGTAWNSGWANMARWGGGLNVLRDIRATAAEYDQQAYVRGPALEAQLRQGLSIPMLQQAGTSRQQLVDLWLNGGPGRQGAMTRYGVDEQQALSALDMTLRYRVPEGQAMLATTAGINVGQGAAGLQGYYGGSLESRAQQAAQYANNPMFLQKGLTGLGTGIGQGFARLGAPVSMRAAGYLPELDTATQQQVGDILGQAYGLQQYDQATGRTALTTQSLIGRAQAATQPGLPAVVRQAQIDSLQRDMLDITAEQQAHAERAQQYMARGYNPTDANARATANEQAMNGNLISGAGFQYMQRQRQRTSSLQGAVGFLAGAGRMDAGAAQALAQRWETSFGGNLGAGQGAAFMQMAQGFMGGNANVVSQVGGIVGAGTMGVTAGGYRATGADFITQQMGGITGFAGMGVGESSIMLPRAQGGTPIAGLGYVNPAFASVAAASLASRGLANNGLLGTYTPMGVAGGWLPSSYRVGGQTYEWGKNIGGMLGLQMASSDAAFRASMASVGASYGNAQREQVFTTGIGLGAKPNMYSGQPLPWSTTGAMGQPFVEGQGQWYWQDQGTLLNRQQQQYAYGFGQQSRGLQAQQFAQGQALQASQFAQTQAFNIMQAGLGYGRQQQDFGIQGRMMRQQRQWTTEDFAYDRGNQARTFGWQMEDIDLELRYATGRDRIALERQKKRATITHDVEGGRIDVMEARQKEMWKNEDQRFAIEKARAEEDYKLRMRQFDMEREHFTQSAEMSKRHFLESQALQTENADRQMTFTQEQWKIEDAQRQLEREYWKENQAAQMAAIGAQAGAIIEQKKFSDEQLALQIGMRAQQAQVAQWYDTEYSMMSTWINHMVSIENALTSGQLGQLGIQPGYDPNVRSKEHAAGFSGVVTSRQLFSVAEQGAEYVSVRPFGRPGFGYARGTDQSANVGSDMTQVIVYIGDEQVAARVERRQVRRLTQEIRR